MDQRSRFAVTILAYEDGDPQGVLEMLFIDRQYLALSTHMGATFA